MKAKALVVLVILALCFPLVAVLTPNLLSPVQAATRYVNPYQSIQYNIDTATPSNSGSIRFTLSAGEYEITKDEDGFDIIQMEGFPLAVSAGDPMLPHKVYNILVPPDILWSSLDVRIISTKTRTLEGAYDVKPAGPDVAWADGRWIEAWGEGKDIVDGRNINVYERDTSFPENPVELFSNSQMRKWKFAKVDFTPFQYNPVSKALDLIDSMEVELSYSQSRAGLDESLLVDTVMDDIAAQMFINYEEAKGWYGREMLRDAQQLTYDYIIITTNAINSSSTMLSSFIAHKESRGHSVWVVTEDDFLVVVGDPPNNRAEKIRKWLQLNYKAFGFEYVLLIGNPNPYHELLGSEGDIPMKMCQPNSTLETPTDYFYADLTGDWDWNDDEIYGAWGEDYPKTDGVDFTPEVYVGRIPVYFWDHLMGFSILDSILQKIIDYETEYCPYWRNSILMPMCFQDPTGPYDGAQLAEQMKDDYLDAAGFSSWRMYQQGTANATNDSIYSSEEELRGGTVVRDRWASTDFGIIAWFGHGSATYTRVGYDPCWDGILMDSTYASSLDDEHPAFTYQCSCNNGYPENEENLQYALLKQGGIATVGATRVSWFNTGVGYGQFDNSTTSSGIGYEYVKRLVQGLPGGDALYQTKQSMSPGSHTRLMNWYDFNLYGDPTTSLRTTPSSAGLATATGTGRAGFCVSSGTIENPMAVPESTLPIAGKPNLIFPHGFFSFDITGLTPGETVNVTITLPSAVPVGTQYWKYHPNTQGGWVRIPMGSDDGDNMITITLVDGGLGDDDGDDDGIIVDQGGPGYPGPAVPVFPSVVVSIGAALAAGLVASALRRRIVSNKS